MRVFQYLSYTLLLSLAVSTQASDQVVGTWNTLDRFGEPESLVELYKSGEELRGRIVKLYDDSKKDAVCEECMDDQENHPIAGLVFITGLENQGEEWINGTVLDPETGNEYDCKLWLDGETVYLKAGFGIISQTKEWARAH